MINEELLNSRTHPSLSLLKTLYNSLDSSLKNTLENRLYANLRIGLWSSLWRSLDIRIKGVFSANID